MAVSWEFFSGRRSVTLREILEAENITCYEELFLKLKHMGVEAPPESSVKWMFNDKSDKIKFPTKENATMDEILEAKKEIDEIIADGDPEAAIPELHIPARPGLNKAAVPGSKGSKKPAPRKRRSARKPKVKTETK
jgi:hypothetical protein